MSDLFPTVHDQLSRAAEDHARRRRRRRRQLPTATALVALTGLAVFLSIGWPSQRLDITSKASAALSAPSELIHTVMTRSIETPGSAGNAPTPDTIEQWAASNPTRWRIAIGSDQVAYRNGTQTTLREGHSAHQTPYDDNAEAPGFGPLGSDPVTTIKSMIDAGELQDAGQVVVDGRQVRRLEGQTSTRFGEATTVLDVTYDVDPESYEPIAARATNARATGDAAANVTIRFERFERLPLTPDNARLLEIQ